MRSLAWVPFAFIIGACAVIGNLGEFAQENTGTTGTGAKTSSSSSMASSSSSSSSSSSGIVDAGQDAECNHDAGFSTICIGPPSVPDCPTSQTCTFPIDCNLDGGCPMTCTLCCSAMGSLVMGCVAAP